MERVLSYQKNENGVLSGYIYTTYKTEVKLKETVIKILVKKNGVPHEKVMFLKNSGQMIDIDTLIWLK